MAADSTTPSTPRKQMSESRKKKGSVPATKSQNDFNPPGDAFERILTTPKESLIQRAASPRRTVASPLKTSVDVCLEQLPRILGKLHCFVQCTLNTAL